MRALTLDRLAPDELEALTDAHLVEMEVRNEFMWRTRTLRPPRLRVEEDHHFRDAIATGRGVIVSFCHVGPSFGLPLVTNRYGRTTTVVIGPAGFRKRKGDAAKRQAQQNRNRRDGHMIPAKGSYDALVAVLNDSGLVGITYDIGGRTPTDFLGRTMQLTSGTARLAAQTDALVVPYLRERRGHRVHATFGPALDPRDFDDFLELHAALGRFHEQWIHEHPAALAPSSDFLYQFGLKPPREGKPPPAPVAAPRETADLPQ